MSLEIGERLADVPVTDYVTRGWRTWKYISGYNMYKIRFGFSVVHKKPGRRHAISQPIVSAFTRLPAMFQKYLPHLMAVQVLAEHWKRSRTTSLFIAFDDKSLFSLRRKQVIHRQLGKLAFPI